MSSGIPPLRFPQFSGAWKRKRLCEVADVIMGASAPPADLIDCGEVRYFGGASDSKKPRRARRGGVMARPFDILIHVRAPVGGGAFLTKEARLGRGCAAIRFSNDYFSLAQAYSILFSLFFEKFGVASQGTTFDSINRKDVESIEIYVPNDHSELVLVAGMVADVWTHEKILVQTTEHLQRFKAGLMQKLFSQELRFTREDGSAFPDWEEKRLGDVGVFLRGKGVSKSDIAEAGTLPCIRYGEIYTLYNERITDIASRTDVPAQDLLLSEMGDVIIPASGETAVDMARACCVLLQGVALGGDINVFRSEMDGEFLAYYLSGARKNAIAQAAQGVSVVHLYASQLRSIQVAIPHPEEQRKIAKAISAMDAKISSVRTQISHIEAFKKGLLQQMFA